MDAPKLAQIICHVAASLWAGEIMLLLLCLFIFEIFSDCRYPADRVSNARRPHETKHDLR